MIHMIRACVCRSCSTVEISAPENCVFLCHKPSMIFVLIFILIAFSPLLADNYLNLLAQFSGEHGLASFGSSLATLDYNHDGYDDLIVASASYGYVQHVSPSRGKVYIYYGGPNFTSSLAPAMTLEGDYPNGQGMQICEVSNVGDINGDGFDDLAIIILYPDRRLTGASRYYFGQSNDLQSPSFVSQWPDGERSVRVSKLGDIDGDGFEDVGWTNLIITNAIVCVIQWGGSYSYETIFTNTANCPASINGVGDVNDDGYDDFCLSSRREVSSNQMYFTDFYYGNILRDFSTPVTIVQNLRPITNSCKRLGDINGDGYADFIPVVDYEGLNVWFGSGGNIIGSEVIALNPIYYVMSLKSTSFGDFNNDGYDDVVSSSPEVHVDDYYYGMLGIWLGSEQMNGVCDLSLYNATGSFGSGLDTGDYNGDGLCDIVVTAPYDWSEYGYGNFPGRIFVYAGNEHIVANADLVQPEPESLQVRICPNPLRSDEPAGIIIEGDAFIKDGEAIIEIFNIKGQLVYKTNRQFRTNNHHIAFGSHVFSGKRIVFLQSNNRRLYFNFKIHRDKISFFRSLE